MAIFEAGKTSLEGVAVLIIVGSFLWGGSTIIYNLFLHPLASFPGPLLWRATRLPWTLALLRGRLVLDSPARHKKYGPVVRIAPNELAFIDVRAWRDIMGGGAAEIPKWKGMYNVPAFLPPHVQNVTNKEHHRVLRRSLAPGFSDASLRAQEPVLAKYINLMMSRLEEKSRAGAVNMELWYRYVVFDIICELAVGESFRCLETDDLHPWLVAMKDGGKAMGFLTALNMYPTLAAIVNAVFSKAAASSLRLHNDFVRPMLENRMRAGDRPDLINPLLRLHGGDESNLDELIANASTIVGAGAETSASTLAAVTSYLIDNPSMLDKLTREVRVAFRSEQDITAEAVSHLPYLVACIDEAMRLFPQTGAPSLRLTEKDTIISGITVPINTVVGIWPYAMYRDETLWTDPNEFHPERFLGDAKYANDAREALKPFFTGSRDCIGQNLALIEMRLILAHVVFKFDIQGTSDHLSRNWTSKQGNLYIVWDKSALPVQLTPAR